MSDTAAPVALDVNRRFVRLLERRPDGFVEFEFAIGEPELCAELLMREADFKAFCATNQVEHLAPAGPDTDTDTDTNADADADAASDWDWSLRQANQQRFR